MADTYMVKINRRDGAIEVSGDKEWVEEKLVEFADVYNIPAGDVPAVEREHERQRPRQKPKPIENGTTKAPRRRAGAPSRVKGLDLAPRGKQSFDAFVAEKQPGNQDDRNVSSVYYLSEVAEIGPVTMDHVYTCYRDRGWPVPADLRNSLQLTASRKGFLDTANMDDIRVEPRGMNHVERALPAKKAD